MLFKVLTRRCTYEKYRAAQAVLPPALVASLAAHPSPPDALTSSFLKARSQLSKSDPNFGRHSFGARQWWAEAISRTFKAAGADLSREPEAKDSLVTALYDGFSSDPNNYTLFEDTLPAIAAIRSLDPPPVLACTSNMDPRLPLILDTLGIKLDFALGSYELDAEKPDAKVWQLVREKASEVARRPIQPEECLHIGDDVEKDVHSPQRAGWKALFIDRRGRERHEGVRTVATLSEVVELLANPGKL